MCKTEKRKSNKINFYKFIWFIRRKLFSKVLQGVKLKKIE